MTSMEAETGMETTTMILTTILTTTRTIAKAISMTVSGPESASPQRDRISISIGTSSRRRTGSISARNLRASCT
jgi:hypothetical protein